jgi:leucyl-tRNA synthetase
MRVRPLPGHQPYARPIERSGVGFCETRYESMSGTDETIPAFRYTARLAEEIELRWQEEWDRAGAFRQPNPGEPGFDASKPKFYCLDMFPYPSGAGLHVGHPEGYTATDIISRYKRMRGYNVLHPMGWDAFGLPAEQYAIQTGVHPAVTTRRAIDNFRRQLRRFGFSYDWSREFGTMDEEYYRWTQWIFLRLYDAWFDERSDRARPISELIEQARRGDIPTPRAWDSMSDDERRAFIDSRRLAYLAETTVNWCPKLGTVLANDEVIDGRSERGGHPVVRVPLKQWAFRITAYAGRLLDQLAWLDWPESTRTMQAEWIGRSEGAEIDFRVVGAGVPPLRVFTTRPDTIFGATYMVVAPEHPLVQAVLASPACETDVAALREYVERSARRSDVERQESRDKSGVFTGLYAMNPATGRGIPIWTAQYVLMGYGTGAIMGVPAHDERDYEFAKAHGLPIRDVMYPRAILAIRHFATRAYEGEPDAHWRERLAEFMSLVTAGGEREGDFDRWLTIAMTAEAPQEKGREAARAAWLEALDDWGIASFEDLRRRFESATWYDRQGTSFDEAGVAVNSSNAEVSIDGMEKARAIETVVAWLERTGRGRRRVNYRLRDWVFSRQRYWGEPFPIVYDRDGRAYPVSAEALPVRLPDLADYAPIESDTPQPLLAKAALWVKTTAGEAGVDPALLPPDTPVWRETNTMPGSAGSSWYAIRFCDPRNTGRFVGREAERYWMGTREAAGKGFVGGVDLYVGGAEHAVGHLLYARFWQNVLYDLGEVSTPEPFRRLFHQGLITSFAYQDAQKRLVPADEAEEIGEGRFVRRGTGEPLTQIVAKMSKSLKNVINPDDVIAEYGADTFRLYEMYMGPLEASKPWNPRDITGLFRFLQRTWRLTVNEESGETKLGAAPDEAVERALHRLIAKVETDIERLSFNTAIAAMIEFVNLCVAKDKGDGVLTREQLLRFVLVLSPFVPHIAEELWRRAGGQGFAMHQAWPTYDESQLRDAEVEVPVQVAGKVRSRVMVPAGADVKQHESIALSDAKVQASIAGRAIKKVIVVPGRMINVVI